MNDLESKFVEKFENEDFQFCNINWWPLIKIQVSFQFHFLRMKGIDSLSYSKSDSLLLGLPNFSRRAYLNYLKRKYSIPKSVANVAVFGFESHINTKYNCNLVNPYIYPFFEYLKKNEISYDTFDFITNKGLTDDYNDSLKHFRRKVIKQFNKDINFQGQISSLSKYLANMVTDKFYLYDYLVDSIIQCQSKFLMYSLFFKKNKYGFVLSYCYYEYSVMSIFRAANNLNIPTVEYQHSQVTSKHFAYSGWNNSIAKSKEFFPTIIWAWRDSDVKYLKKEFSYIPSLQILKGGNLFLSLMKNNHIYNHNSDLKVLVTLQGAFLPSFITEFITESKDIHWYIRLHPRYNDDKPLVEKLKLSNPSNIEIEKANSASIYDLLSDVNYHLTSFSGSAIEAQTFNVTNIIYGEKGYITYKEQIESGMYFHVKNKNDLSCILSNKKIPTINFDPVLTDKELIDENIKLIFK